MPDAHILVIEGSDFETFPAGGQLSMVRSLMTLFGNRLALVGMSGGEDPIGRWVQKEISGSSYLFLSVARGEPSGERPVIPVRLKFFMGLRRFKDTILSLGCRAAFIQAPEGLLAVSRWDWESLCFWFPGVENQLRASRYPLARPLWRLFDRALFTALDRSSVVLAAADERAITGLVSRSNGRLARERVIQFPTSVDTSTFHPAPKHKVRGQLGIPEGYAVFVTVGRIARLKGWELLLDAFEEFVQKHANALLFFVGDGEDKSLLQDRIDARNLTFKAKITGFQAPSQVASYINAADVILSGSLLEGWSVAMLEALACGKAIVSTEVSGTTEMIKPGQNGFIVRSRNPRQFSEAMERALGLRNAEEISTSIASGFDSSRLRERLISVWPPFRRTCMAATQPKWTPADANTPS